MSGVEKPLHGFAKMPREQRQAMARAGGQATARSGRHPFSDQGNAKRLGRLGGIASQAARRRRTEEATQQPKSAEQA